MVGGINVNLIVFIYFYLCFYILLFIVVNEFGNLFDILEWDVKLSYSE